jgi:hypothetical protein
VLAFLGTPAFGQDLENSASGSMTISVTIAPFGAAFAAASEGAIGAWSVSGKNDGVMLSAPEMITADRANTISIFTNSNAAVAITPLDQRAKISLQSTSDFKGLNRQDFTLRARETSDTSPLSVLISTI